MEFYSFELPFFEAGFHVAQAGHEPVSHVAQAGHEPGSYVAQVGYECTM